MSQRLNFRANSLSRSLSLQPFWIITKSDLSKSNNISYNVHVIIAHYDSMTIFQSDKISNTFSALVFIVFSVFNNYSLTLFVELEFYVQPLFISKLHSEHLFWIWTNSFNEFKLIISFTFYMLFWLKSIHDKIVYYVTVGQV